MKIIITLVLNLILIASVYTQGINFEHTTLKQALSKAQKENKLVFLDGYTSWCGPCKWLSKEIFPKKEAGDFFNKHFVNIKIDMEKGEGKAIRKQYAITSFPTLLFLNSKGIEVYRMVGGMQVDKLIAGAKAAMDPSLSLENLKTKFNNGNRDYNFLIQYLTAYKRRYDKKNQAKVAQVLLKKYGLEKFLTKDLFYVIQAAKIKFETKNYDYLIKHKQQILTKIDIKVFNRVITKIIRTHLHKYSAMCKSLKELNIEMDKCKKDIKFHPYFASSFVLNYYIENKKFDKWYKLRIEDAEKNKTKVNYIYSIYNIAKQINEDKRFKNSKKLFKRALKIGEKMIKTNDGLIMGNLLLAQLYAKNKNKKAAKKHFDTFFEMNAKAGGNNTHHSVTDLKKIIDKL